MLGKSGEPPPWGKGGGTSSLDSQIEGAGDLPEDQQRQLFFGCARHLYDLQVRDSVEESYDHSDDNQWLADLATWLGWTDDLRDQINKEAMRAAAVILDHAIPDTGERT